jgi:hypothetical protein
MFTNTTSSPANATVSNHWIHFMKLATFELVQPVLLAPDAQTMNHKEDIAFGLSL